MSGVDVRKLERDLDRTVRGAVRFDSGARALYATDASNYRMLPIGVVTPRDEGDVVRAVAVCRDHDVPVLGRGGGTSLAGQCCNAAVVLDFSRHLNRILELRPEERWARVQPGVVLDRLREAAEQHGLTFAPDPSTHNHCTLGGMLGNDSCGVHSVMGGRTSDNTHELDVLTYDGERMSVGANDPAALAAAIAAGGRRGEIHAALKALVDREAGRIRARFPGIPRLVSGFNLTALLPENGFHVARALVGTEGTCVTILGAKLRLVPSPRARALVLIGYADVYRAADDVPDVMSAGPIGLEGMDGQLVQDIRQKNLHPGSVRLLPEGDGWLLAEVGGDTGDEAGTRARALAARVRAHARDVVVITDPEEQKQLWKLRESGLAATARVPGAPDSWPGWEDSAVPPERLGSYLRKLRELFDRFGYCAALYGHFGQGCVHCRIDFDLKTAAGIAKWRSFLEAAADLVVGLGGSLSGEHGDGQARAELLPRMFGDELVAAFRQFKAIWDPRGRMNPGKVVTPFRADQHLRLGTDYGPAWQPTYFSFNQDAGNFARATLRCVGVGECRRDGEGVMCPSYRVTREEEHSTRGRAHLLFEMMRGDELAMWSDPHVREALDLCLACKGCKSDCPMQVDMATYKAEFLAHYYERRRRPRHAYAMGYIDVWARFASRMPRLVNALTHAPVLSRLIKVAGGISAKRAVPRFAVRTFRRGFAPHSGEGREVMLWPDTFTDHFAPDIGHAAVTVLERAGFRPILPPDGLCCGRPLYDFGFLSRARRLLETIVDRLRPQIRAGVPLVALEPSCTAVFRDELLNMLPHDEDARRLAAQTFLISELLARELPDWQPGRLERRALVQTHCHQHAVLDPDADARLLDALGVNHRPASEGCCGMAGSFGFEAAHRDLSVACAERELLPAVRAADPDVLIVANGFSCREQILQETGRRAFHVAEVLAMAQS